MRKRQTKKIMKTLLVITPNDDTLLVHDKSDYQTLYWLENAKYSHNTINKAVNSYIRNFTYGTWRKLAWIFK